MSLQLNNISPVWPDGYDFSTFSHVTTTLKGCPKTLQFGQSRIKIFPNTEKALNHLTKIKKMLSKWQNFAKSGHTEYNTRLFC